MKIATLQLTIDEQAPQKNLERALNLVENHARAEDKADIYVLPEMFTCGYNFSTWANAAAMTSQAMEELGSLAQRHNCAITASLPFQDDNMESSEDCVRYFNRMVFIGRTGATIASYDKIHLFALMNEDKYVTPGNNLVTFDYNGWRISLLVCFDLRFPVPFYRCALDGAEMFLMCAEWPATRIETMEILCRSRAIETQSYLVMSNRTGGAFDNQVFGGHSMIVDPLGDFTAAPDEGDFIMTRVCKKELLEKTRARINVFAARSQTVDL